MKRCLILSNGPVQTPEHNKVEGGGLRCWGLARGIHANNDKVEVTVAYNELYKNPDRFTENYEGIKLRTWNLLGIKALIKDYDTVIVSYCMGDLSVKVADYIMPDQQLILDCYVPIYIEVSARDSGDLETEYRDFHNDVGRWAHVLRRGDLFLCANQAQLSYYKGVLSGLGRINPATYGEELIKIVPYGIYRDSPKVTSKPISNLIKDNSVKKILWFGGIYPWFDLRNLVDAVKTLNETIPSKLIIVGAKNPFNDHPDFVGKYNELVEYINSSGASDITILQDWVKFEERANWYMDSDIVVAINREGEENKLAWRTRLVDYIWSDLPIITNGGDPLGEILLASEAALRFSDLTTKAIANDLEKAFDNPQQINKLRANLAEIRKDYYWDNVTEQLTDAIKAHEQAADRRLFGEVEHKSAIVASRSKLSKVYSKALMVPSYAKKYGWRNTYFVIRTKATNRLRRIKRPGAPSPKAIFIAHQLDISGAPFVFMDVLEYLKAKYPKLPIDFYTFNPAHYANITKLNKMGVKPKIFLSRDIGFDFNKGDVVVLNTVGHTMVLKDSIFSALESGTVNQLVWYIHEDEPELIFSSSETIRIKKLLANQKITMFMAGQQTLDDYQKFFDNTKQIKLQPYKIAIPKKHQHVKKAQDFNDLRFVLPGTVTDGRKGHLPILYAFINFKNEYYDKDPGSYRNFKLEFIGLGDDFLSRQILNHAPKGLGEHFGAQGKIAHEAMLDFVDKCNVTICYSLREALPLFVFEGMYSGHPILRNDSSGMKEQLKKGKNGYYLESKNYAQIVETLEEVLNKQKTSNAKLAEMSKQSYAMAAKQADNDYSVICQDIYSAFSRD